MISRKCSVPQHLACGRQALTHSKPLRVKSRHILGQTGSDYSSEVACAAIFDTNHLLVTPVNKLSQSILPVAAFVLVGLTRNRCSTRAVF